MTIPSVPRWIAVLNLLELAFGGHVAGCGNRVDVHAGVLGRHLGAGLDPRVVVARGELTSMSVTCRSSSFALGT